MQYLVCTKGLSTAWSQRKLRVVQKKKFKRKTIQERNSTETGEQIVQKAKEINCDEAKQVKYKQKSQNYHNKRQNSALCNAWKISYLHQSQKKKLRHSSMQSLCNQDRSFSLRCQDKRKFCFTVIHWCSQEAFASEQEDSYVIYVLLRVFLVVLIPEHINTRRW